MDFSASIVIPVWNRLEALGTCLANLAEHTPDTQIILMDMGSERETERRLEQFADVLEDRVLLMHEPLNRGKTAAINRGIASAAAEYVVVLSPMSVVTPNWLPPLLQTLRDHPDIGVVCPDFATGDQKRRLPTTATGLCEMHHGSFFCQVMHRHLFDSVGPFADTLDGSTWCLADFSRRVWQAGFTTARCHGSLVYTTPEQVFGSTERRLKLQEESEQNYAGRWETPASYCLCLAEVQSWWPTILTGARQGDTFVIVTPAALAQRIREDGLDRQHEGITFSPLPRLLPERRGRQMLARLLSAEPTLHVATDTATLPLPPGIAVQSITTIADKIIEREKRLYGRPPAKEH